ncbi:unnamed protein product [Brassicogethes aeneus]|uniref:Peptidase S1 domain-containing protein n=1 Tax=Brassicogethes aeneus TaxID=1431903 RepID=A0A9P0FGQ6_BRAAE|nr:unnamed protein product [Brassicogethes aeneus]
MVIFLVTRASNMRPMVLLILLLCCVFRFSTTAEVCGQFDVNGKSWNVAIYREENNGDLKSVCLGSIIGPNVILTAARCFCEHLSKNPLDKQFYVLAGPESRNTVLREIPANIQKVLKSNIFVHENYEGLLGFYEHDIALVKLKNKLSYDANVNPVCVDWGNNNPNIQENSVGKQVVWANNALEILDAVHSDYEDCSEECYKLKWQDFLTNDKICTRSNGVVFEENNCGAGLLIKENGSWHIKGVLSSQDNVAHKINLYTKVNRYLNWITKTHALISRKN